VANFSAGGISYAALGREEAFSLGVTAQFANRCNVLDVIGIGIGAHGEVVWNPPEEDLSVVGTGGNQVIVERIPVSVEHDCGVAPKQRDAFRKLATLLKGNDGEGTTTTSFPIDRKVFRVNLDQVGIPGVSGDAKVIVALFLATVLKGNVVANACCS
jgi:hypothetical protein